MAKFKVPGIKEQVDKTVKIFGKFRAFAWEMLLVTVVSKVFHGLQQLFLYKSSYISLKMQTDMNSHSLKNYLH